MTEEQLKELESLKSPIAKEAAEFIRNIVNSPFYDGYLAVKITIDNLNLELQDGAAKIITDDEDNDKQFERSHKYITEMKPYYEQLQYFRSQLLPEQVVEANAAAGSVQDQARERLKNRNGSKV